MISPHALRTFRCGVKALRVHANVAIAAVKGSGESLYLSWKGEMHKCNIVIIIDVFM